VSDAPEIIDDLSPRNAVETSGIGWLLISDRVMGGVSSGSVQRESVAGRPAIRMRGGVSLENNGGFLQMAIDLGENGSVADASGWIGIQLDVLGNDQSYNLHLRTTDLQRPWESYRQSFTAPAHWTRFQLPFGGFVPHRTERPLRTSRLRRIGLVAIGRQFEVDLAIGDIRFYGTPSA
jgi:hypothetical protein